MFIFIANNLFFYKMSKRKITKLNNLKFEPFNKYGKPIKGWSWHKISFDKKAELGTSWKITAIWGSEGAIVAPDITVNVLVSKRTAFSGIVEMEWTLLVEFFVIAII